MRKPSARPTMDSWIAAKLRIEPGKPLTRQDIDVWQLDALNQTFELAFNHSSLYRERFGRVHLNSLEDMSSLPFTTPDDLRKNPLKMLCVSPSDISRIVTISTSGTTGGSKRVYFTPEDQELCIDFFHHGMQLLVDRFDTVGILFPAAIAGSVGDLLQKGLDRLGARSLALFTIARDPRSLARLLFDENATSLAGPPSIIESLAEHYRKHPQLPRPTIKSVLLSADFVSDRCRQSIKNIWNADIYEHYGMTEMGLGCAVSCEGQLKNPDTLGYHIREADIYIEIINPATGKPSGENEKGEIVFTTLTRQGMPFIRYKTGDISCFIGDSCSCGSVLRLLGRVHDRGLKKNYPNMSPM